MPEKLKTLLPWAQFFVLFILGSMAFAKLQTEVLFQHQDVGELKTVVKEHQKDIHRIHLSLIRIETKLDIIHKETLSE